MDFEELPYFMKEEQVVNRTKASIVFLSDRHSSAISDSYICYNR